MSEDFDRPDFGDPEYYDDLGGAYYSADEKESFEPRTPGGGGGCASLFILFFTFLSVLISPIN